MQQVYAWLPWSRGLFVPWPVERCLCCVGHAQGSIGNAPIRGLLSRGNTPRLTTFFRSVPPGPFPPVGCGRDVARLPHPVEASGHGLRSGRIKRMVINHFSFLSPTPTPLVARPQPKALWPSKAIPSTCCPKTSWPTTNLTFIGVLRFHTCCAGSLALFVSCTDNGRLHREKPTVLSPLTGVYCPTLV
jgi:hypothetical protein